MLSIDGPCDGNCAKGLVQNGEWKQGREWGQEMMNAIAALRPNVPEAPDPALLLAAVQAFPGNLAILASGRVVFANPGVVRNV